MDGDKHSWLTALVLLALAAFVSPVAGAITLNAALDNSNLVFQTSNPYPWFGTNNPSYDGISAAVSGNQFVNSSESWIQVTLVGPGLLSFWWKVSSDTNDYFEFSINGELQDEISGGIDWNYRSYAIPDGTNVVKWDYVKDFQYGFLADRAYLDEVHWIAGPQTSLQEALNTCGVVWTSGGNTNPTYWASQTNVTHDGFKAAQSGQITALQQSILQSTIRGVTNVSFWWRVSSEYDSSTKPITVYDNLGFYVDGVLQTNINVENTWQQKSYHLTTNLHTIQWIYSKDASDTLPKGSDCGWVDQVVFSPPLKALPYSFGTPNLLSNNNFQIPITGEVGCTCRLQFASSPIATNWTTLTNFLTATATTICTDLTASNADARYYRTLSP
jgi:hypothetical protein